MRIFLAAFVFIAFFQRRIPRYSKNWLRFVRREHLAYRSALATCGTLCFPQVALDLRLRGMPLRLLKLAFV